MQIGSEREFCAFLDAMEKRGAFRLEVMFDSEAPEAQQYRWRNVTLMDTDA